MNTDHCPTCRRPWADDIPPEPPVGTWVKDRHGGTSRRTPEGWGTPGFYALGVWASMWKARGPLVVCGEWGQD